MNENLFSFPGEANPDEGSPFGDSFFVDLGDEKDEENPFADMSNAAESTMEETSLRRNPQ